MVRKETQPFKGMWRSGDVMGAGEMSWGDVCLGEGRRGTEDRREEQQGEGKRKKTTKEAQLRNLQTCEEASTSKFMNLTDYPIISIQDNFLQDTL